jgi:hypothetical protein
MNRDAARTQCVHAHHLTTELPSAVEPSDMVVPACVSRHVTRGLGCRSVRDNSKRTWDVRTPIEVAG